MQAGGTIGPAPLDEAEDVTLFQAPSMWSDPACELELKSLILERSVDGLLAHTTDGRIVYLNGATAKFLGRTSTELRAAGPWGWLPREDREDARARIAILRARGTLLFTAVSTTMDGVPMQMEVHSTLVRTPKGELVVSTIRDVTDRAQAHERIRHLAFHDRLTGLANRARLEDDLRCALKGADRHNDLVGVIYIDLDDFKPVNDVYGHAAGDEVLRVVASRMRDSVRDGDTVARLGGDEFIALITRLNTKEDLAAVGLKLVRSIEDPLSIAGREVRVTASAGLAVYEPGEEAEDLMNRADHAMYRAKQAGVPGWEAFLSA